MLTYTGVAWDDDTRVYYEVGRVEPSGGIEGIVAREDGPSVAGWRSPAFVAGTEYNCMESAFGVGDGYAAMAATYVEAADTSRNIDQIYYAPISTIGAATVPALSLTTGVASLGNFVQRLSVTASLVVADMQPAHSLLLIQGSTERAAGGTTIVGSPQNAVAVGDHAVWEDWGATVRLATDSIAGAPEYLVDATPGEVHELATDGTTLAWMQTYNMHTDMTFDRVELWTSPVAFHAADLSPRRVLSETGIGLTGARIGGGWLARFQGTSDAVELVSLADGSKRVFSPPAGVHVVEQPLSMSSRELLLVLSDATTYRYLVRIDPSTLRVE